MTETKDICPMVLCGSDKIEEIREHNYKLRKYYEYAKKNLPYLFKKISFEYFNDCILAEPITNEMLIMLCNLDRHQYLLHWHRPYTPCCKESVEMNKLKRVECEKCGRILRWNDDEFYKVMLLDTTYISKDKLEGHLESSF